MITTQPPRFLRKSIDPDAALVAQLRRADTGAAEALVGAYGDRVYRLAIGITGNASDAEEVVQDAFWSALKNIDTFRGDASLGSWIYRIVANAAYQNVRRRRHRRDEICLEDILPSFQADGRHAGPVSDWSARIDDPAIQTELRAALDSAIEDLPPAHRVAIVLRDVEGVSMRGVADALNITVANASGTQPPLEILVTLPARNAVSTSRKRPNSGPTRHHDQFHIERATRMPSNVVTNMVPMTATP